MAILIRNKKKIKRDFGLASFAEDALAYGLPAKV
jgi:hypothetical protein